MWSFSAHPQSLVRVDEGTGAASSCPVLWATFILVSLSPGSGRECWGLLLAVAAVTGGGCATFHWFPLDWFKALAGVGHSQAIWPQPWHLKHLRELGSLLLALPSCLSLAPWLFCPWSLLIVVPVPQLVDVLWLKAVSQISLAIMGAGAARSTSFHPSPPTASLSGAIWGTDWAVALPCPGQGSHEFGNLVPQFCGTLLRVGGHGSPSPYFITGFLILTFCLVGGNHQLRIRGPGVTVEIPYGISDVFADSMEETVFEVFLDL